MQRQCIIIIYLLFFILNTACSYERNIPKSIAFGYVDPGSEKISNEKRQLEMINEMRRVMTTTVDLQQASLIVYCVNIFLNVGSMKINLTCLYQYRLGKFSNRRKISASKELMYLWLYRFVFVTISVNIFTYVCITSR